MKLCRPSNLVPTASLSRAFLNIILKSLYSSASPSTTNNTTNEDAPTKRIAKETFKSSVYTGKADFYEAFFFLQDILKRAQSVSKPTPLATASANRIPWYPQEKMADYLGFNLTKLQYRQFRNSLNLLVPFSHLSEVGRFLQTFTPLESLSSVLGAQRGVSEKALAKLSGREPNLGSIDSKGRAISIGRRKSSSAKIMMVKGTGQCWVNGKPAIEYFKRMKEMFKIAEPFKVTATFGRYNAWCLVRGGGLSGQSGAISHGLAKALVLLNQNYKAPLLPYLKRDPRTVERKKPGQPKARKKFTWVKR